MRVSLLTIGDELLIGQVVDTNAAYIGAFLAERDVQLVRSLTVEDSLDSIATGLQQARRGVNVVLLTGGLGPTADDLTIEALAQHLGRGLEFNQDTFDRIAYIFTEIIKRPLAASHRRQAMQPAGAVTLENKQGTAPGLWIEDSDQVLIAMPGVPREMKYLLSQQVMPRLQARYPLEHQRQRTLLTAGWGETQIADAIDAVARVLPQGASLAYLPGLGTVRVRITMRGAHSDQLDVALDALEQRIVELLPTHLVVNKTGLSLVAQLHADLQRVHLRVAVAESCTGGSIGRLLTEVPGASSSFVGGIIAYDNAIKVSLLGVNEGVIDEVGAVSEEVVKQMVAGAIACTGADVAVAASGVAGPGGGTPDKPVGTVWLAAGSAQQVRTLKLSLGRDRETNMDYSAVAAINLLRRFVAGD